MYNILFLECNECAEKNISQSLIMTVLLSTAWLAANVGENLPGTTMPQLTADDAALYCDTELWCSGVPDYRGHGGGGEAGGHGRGAGGGQGEAAGRPRRQHDAAGGEAGRVRGQGPRVTCHVSPSHAACCREWWRERPVPGWTWWRGPGPPTGTTYSQSSSPPRCSPPSVPV